MDSPPAFVGRPARAAAVAGDMEMLDDAVNTMEQAATLKVRGEYRTDFQYPLTCWKSALCS